MPLKPPNVRVKDRETGHEYEVSEARYKRTPHLWERLGDPTKPKTTVSAEAAKKQAVSGHQADSNKEES